MPPTSVDWWQSPQPGALYVGPSPSSIVSSSSKMNLLSSNDLFGTGSPAHSSTGVPFGWNPLCQSSVRASISVVGASVIPTCPPTAAGNTSAATVKTMTTISLSNFNCCNPCNWARRDQIEGRVTILGFLMEGSSKRFRPDNRLNQVSLWRHRTTQNEDD